jgi:hypothetical protein
MDGVTYHHTARPCDLPCDSATAFNLKALRVRVGHGELALLGLAIAASASS